jgi:hypothetical protein
MFGNPETTTGGNALKFYASVRLDIRRTSQLKDGEEIIGSRTRVKIVKNKLAPPFRKADFDILYGEGISQLGEIVDLGVDFEIIKKSGSWFSYGDTKLGQGRDAVKLILRDNPELYDELKTKVSEALNKINKILKTPGACWYIKPMFRDSCKITKLFKMTRSFFSALLLAMLFSSSCRQESIEKSAEAQVKFDNSLTQEEKSGGVMTPEIMWKFRRLEHLPFHLMVQRSYIQLLTLISQPKPGLPIFLKYPAAGGDPVQLTSDGGSSPQWFNNGKSIAYVNKGKLYTMQADGTEQGEVVRTG